MNLKKSHKRYELFSLYLCFYDNYIFEANWRIYNELQYLTCSFYYTWIQFKGEIRAIYLLFQLIKVLFKLSAYWTDQLWLCFVIALVLMFLISASCAEARPDCSCYSAKVRTPCLLCSSVTTATEPAGRLLVEHRVTGGRNGMQLVWKWMKQQIILPFVAIHNATIIIFPYLYYSSICWGVR